ncbi:hypothetical protein [Spiroplasma eriocheiris]|uniref:Uncharacterized protein n=1 Tax=Spiroplasma eriocheiris TaxID=315358 RepID=A0A0H3XMJ5_9MOLU|nr:hypothetical protein [Spiroplasma eriocheiris]AHF57726.1 hypothetical protein SPE_0598 [Spiroplasma eriocheiris CCTCC M 207170]AKM54177.1 hypothetical protein SERIO_v1c06060 [Spiroplasma eriocheiris]
MQKPKKGYIWDPSEDITNNDFSGPKNKLIKLPIKEKPAPIIEKKYKRTVKLNYMGLSPKAKKILILTPTTVVLAAGVGVGIYFAVPKPNPFNLSSLNLTVLNNQYSIHDQNLNDKLTVGISNLLDHQRSGFKINEDYTINIFQNKKINPLHYYTDSGKMDSISFNVDIKATGHNNLLIGEKQGLIQISNDYVKVDLATMKLDQLDIFSTDDNGEKLKTTILAKVHNYNIRIDQSELDFSFDKPLADNQPLVAGKLAVTIAARPDAKTVKNKVTYQLLIRNNDHRVDLATIVLPEITNLTTNNTVEQLYTTIKQTIVRENPNINIKELIAKIDSISDPALPTDLLHAGDYRVKVSAIANAQTVVNSNIFWAKVASQVRPDHKFDLTTLKLDSLVKTYISDNMVKDVANDVNDLLLKQTNLSNIQPGINYNIIITDSLVPDQPLSAQQLLNSTSKQYLIKVIAVANDPFLSHSKSETIIIQSSSEVIAGKMNKLLPNGQTITSTFDLTLNFIQNPDGSYHAVNDLKQFVINNILENAGFSWRQFELLQRKSDLQIKVTIPNERLELGKIFTSENVFQVKVSVSYRQENNQDLVEKSQNLTFQGKNGDQPLLFAITEQSLNFLKNKPWIYQKEFKSDQTIANINQQILSDFNQQIADTLGVNFDVTKIIFNLTTSLTTTSAIQPGSNLAITINIQIKNQSGSQTKTISFDGNLNFI